MNSYNIYNNVLRMLGEKSLCKGLCCLIFMFCFCSLSVLAQDTLATRIPKAQLRRDNGPATFLDSLANDSANRVKELEAALDSVSRAADDVIAAELDTIKSEQATIVIPSDEEIEAMLEKQIFIPNPKTAMWLAIAFPGGGQIYNRKYWKLPIIYGGFMGCVYALNWNNTMYRDYSQAYIDIMDSDPNTKSYENFIPRGYDINRNLQHIQDMFKRRKNYYRRYRDLSIFCMIGVYALSIVDAYVDAELSSFDISRDLSMKVRPSIINDKHSLAVRNPYASQSYGVQCSLRF